MGTAETYNDKRDFRKTPEPKGDSKKSKNSRFVIQKHDAQQLHYDFRLEIDGALVSWAVPKGLSTAANEKRLAIRTENHPLDYADFEGTIPEDEYGGGTVMVWDKGEYEPVGHDDDDKDKDNDNDEPETSMTEALEDGALKFALYGEKIKGGYAMARTSDKGDDDEQWVIFKLDDEHADARRKPTSTEPKSVKTDRTLEEIEEEEEEGDDNDE